MSRSLRLPMILILTMILSVLLAACGSTTSSGSSPNALSGSITFWAYQGSPEATVAMKQLQTEFQSAHPGTTVNVTMIPKDSFIPKETTAIATGTQPDVSFIDQPLIARYAADKVIDTVPSGLVDESQFFLGALNTNRVGGKLYGLPLSQTCVALFYNKDLVPTPPTTWDEMLAISKQIYNPAKQIAAVSFPRSGDYGGWDFPAFVNEAGGTMLDEQSKTVTFADQPGIDALTYLQQLAKYSPSKITDGANAFQTGHVGMLVSGPWEISGFRTNFPDLKWGVTLLPAGKRQGTNIGGEDGAVFSKSKNKALAWAWLKFLTNKDTNVTFNDKFSGNFPITQIVTDPNNAWVAADPTRSIFLNQMKYAQARPTVADWLKINDEAVGKAMENAIVNGMDPAQALAAAKAQAQQILGW